jgi:hypothetical protein
MATERRFVNALCLLIEKERTASLRKHENLPLWQLRHRMS